MQYGVAVLLIEPALTSFSRAETISAAPMMLAYNRGVKP